MRAFITLVVAAALTAAVPAVAGAEPGCAPAPPKRGDSQVRTGQHSTPAGAAELRGGPDHIGATLGESYLFADGDPNGGFVYGRMVVDGRVGPYHVTDGFEFRIGGGSGQSDACAEAYER